VAAQDQALQTKYHATKLLNTQTGSKCRVCQQCDETIDHIISACPILAKEYIKRYDRMSAQLHFNLCKETGVQLDKKHWYEHVPKSVETSLGGKVTILWNQQVQTDRTTNNKPDIVIRDIEKGTCTLIDVAISGDRNVIKKEGEKILKYKEITIEIQRMWNVKTKVMPVIIGATETISKSFRKYVRKIPENHEVKELQKTDILDTAHTLRKVLT
jgi:hypothetical protein